MSANYYPMWEQLGLDIPAHDQLLGILGQFYQNIYLSQENRPQGNTCALIKSFMGFKLAKLCPFIESCDLVVGETTCDGKKKAYEILGEHSPAYVKTVTCRSTAPPSRPTPNGWSTSWKWPAGRPGC